MDGRSIFASIVRQVGLRATLRAYWASRGKGLVGFCFALADDGWTIWYDNVADCIRCQKAPLA